MADTQVTWGGLTLGGGGPLHVEEITGWDDLPDIDSLDEPRARAHGDHIGDLYARGRVVTVSGSIANRTARDTLAGAVLAATSVSSTVQPLTIETFGRALTAGARLLRRSLPVGDNYPAGQVPFALQWKCPDPLRYGPTRAVSTGLPTSGGGLTYPLTFPLNYGALGNTGQLVLANPGSAETPVQFRVTGALPQGFEISAAGQRLTYPTAVPSGQQIELDTARGTVLVEGTASRRSNLIIADWITVPPATTLTVQFTSLGGAYDAAAQLSATWAEANW